VAETQRQKRITGRVMHEFKHGRLKSGPGGKAGAVKNRGPSRLRKLARRDSKASAAMSITFAEPRRRKCGAARLSRNRGKIACRCVFVRESTKAIWVERMSKNLPRTVKWRLMHAPTARRNYPEGALQESSAAPQRAVLRWQSANWKTLSASIDSCVDSA
jgi:hypothetical protein